jgi:hypothetical protein
MHELEQACEKTDSKDLRAMQCSEVEKGVSRCKSGTFTSAHKHGGQGRDLSAMMLEWINASASDLYTLRRYQHRQ